MITSSQNPKLKMIRSLLSRSKERREAGAFVAEGVRLVEEALAANWPMRFVLFAHQLSVRAEQLVKSCEARGIAVEEISADLLQSISETESSQGILAVLEDHRMALPHNLDFVLIPDQIHDPGNLGTLIRSAAAAGVQAVLIPPETVDVFSAKVLRSGMGAHFRLAIQTMPWEEIRQTCLQDRLEVSLADMQGQSCWEADLLPPLALIVGSEAEGASRQARDLATRQISVPMPGEMESLNAGVAGSLLMFEVVRQRSNRK